jgi:hypothetical protein
LNRDRIRRFPVSTGPRRGRNRAKVVAPVVAPRYLSI